MSKIMTSFFVYWRLMCQASRCSAPNQPWKFHDQFIGPCNQNTLRPLFGSKILQGVPLEGWTRPIKAFMKSEQDQETSYLTR